MNRASRSGELLGAARRVGATAIGGVVLLSFVVCRLSSQQTRAERSHYTETSTHADVIAFIDSLQARGAQIRVGSIGTTLQGRVLPYIIASRPVVTTPAEAKRLGRPIVYVQGNIHAGEVEGKEALQALVRDLVFDPKKNVLDSVVLIAVPDYNADGNDNLGPQARNRGAQNGPELVGTRANASNINLNRDYVRAETPETRGSLAMFNAWDPDVFVDLHTTDGSFHGYALTYAPSLHPAAAIPGATFGGAFTRDSLLPVLRQRMRARHKFEIFDYGNFSGNFSGDEGPRAAAGEMRSWNTYEHTPRYGTNYYGLRGRLSVLSEAFSHDPLERRVRSTYAFVRELLSLTAERARSVLAVARSSDAGLVSGRPVDVALRAAITTHPSTQLVIEERLDTLPEARDSLRAAGAAAAAARAAGGGAGGGRGGRGGALGGALGGGRGGGARGGSPPCPWPLAEPGLRCGFRRTGKFVPQRMLVRDRFDPTLTARLPVAYLLRRVAGTDSLIAQLRRHGVVVEQLTGRLDARGEQFTIDTLRTLPPRDGHSDVRLDGRWSAAEHVTGDAGDFIVRGAQPLGVLAAVLLEPESDDGLTAWNFFDAALAPIVGASDPAARVFPVFRLTAPLAAPTRIVP